MLRKVRHANAEAGKGTTITTDKTVFPVANVASVILTTTGNRMQKQLQRIGGIETRVKKEGALMKDVDELEKIAFEEKKGEAYDKAMDLLLSIAKNPETILQVGIRTVTVIRDREDTARIRDVQGNAPNIYVREAVSKRDISKVGNHGVYC
ncbi:MAG: hypothetical protein ABIG39_07770 [Candidatus Micrarchaeota archaeon]